MRSSDCRSADAARVVLALAEVVVGRVAVGERSRARSRRLSGQAPSRGHFRAARTRTRTPKRARHGAPWSRLRRAKVSGLVAGGQGVRQGGPGGREAGVHQHLGGTRLSADVLMTTRTSWPLVDAAEGVTAAPSVRTSGQPGRRGAGREGLAQARRARPGAVDQARSRRTCSPPELSDLYLPFGTCPRGRSAGRSPPSGVRRPSIWRKACSAP